jgi:hypothetical protein
MHFVLRTYARMRVRFKFWRQFGVLERVATSLLEVGRVIFGGADGIISYLRARRLLSRNQNCVR